MSNTRGSKMRAALALLVGAAGWLAAGWASAEQVRCPVVKDVWVSCVGEEAEHSMGKTETLKLKVLQEQALMDFDVSGLKGKQIRAAWLYLHPAETTGPLLIEGRETNLRWIVVSTVSSEWEEGRQAKQYEKDPEGHGATYNEASSGRKPWAWKGGELSFMINGHFNSVWSVGELVQADGGYWKVPVDAKVVRALVAGLGDGLSVMDGSGSVRFNSFIHSREAAGKEPYLLVEVGEPAAGKPDAPQVTAVEPDPAHATPDGGALRIEVKPPKEIIGYHVKVDGKAMEPWQVEQPSGKGTDRVVLEDLPPGKEVTVEVAVVDAAGNLSDWTAKTGKVSAKTTVPALPKVPFEPKGGEPAKAGQLAVWAFPEVVEVDPVSTLPLFESKKDGFKLANSVWSGAEGKVRLAAAKGEIVAFQLALENKGEPARAHLMVNLQGPDGQALPKGNIRLHRVWYVQAAAGERGRGGDQAAGGEPKWNSEYAIPMDDGMIQVPAPDNKIPDQALQAVYVDIIVPLDAKPGTYTGQLMVHTQDGQATLPLEVVVYPVTIPKELNFNPELNCYRGPAPAGSKEFFDYHRLAHYNRCTINRVPYGQDGTEHEDMVPPLAGEGAETHVADWAEYDKKIGPLLTGAAFQGLPRDGVPVASFYLPVFENWPMKLQGHYEKGMPPKAQREVTTEAEAFSEEQDFNWKEVHDLTAKPVAQAFDEAYQKGFQNVVAQFAKHYAAKGYTRTIYEFYQNNKYNYRGQWWTLDEPTEWLDWSVLHFFADMFHDAAADTRNVRFLYRGDISRPQWQGGFMNGRMGIMYSGGSGLGWPRLLMHMRERDDMIVYVYGSCNEVGRNNFESAAWCLKAFAVGGDGVLPWQSLGGGDSFTKANPLGLLVDGQRFGQTAVASLRVLALRHGAQQCELLRQVLDAHKDWSRWHATALVSQKVPLVSQFRQRFADEAAAATFRELTGQQFAELKEGLLIMLSKGAAVQPEAVTSFGPATQP